MLSSCDIKKLDQMISDFNYVTGVSITPFDADGHPITTAYTVMGDYCKFINSKQSGRYACGRSNKLLMKKCRESKKTERHICASGLLDIAIPLIHRGEMIAVLMIGQIRTNNTLPDIVFSSQDERDKFKEFYYKIPLFDERMIESVINMGSILTKYILFENIIKAPPRQSATMIADYIDEHLGENLSVKSISENTHISVSGIYKSMRQSYGKTLGEYILELRLTRAEALLREENMSIEKVAETVGFSDPAYFSRCFKKSRGIPPIKYKKLSKAYET